MKRILLDAECIHSESQAHEYIKSAFGMGVDEKCDLDSLYSRVMSIKEDTEIVLENSDLLVDTLGRYGLGIIKLMREASNESGYVTFTW